MKTIPIILSLAVGANAQRPEGGAAMAGNIRASKLVKTKRSAASSPEASSSTTKNAEDKKLHTLAQRRTKEEHATREERSRRKVVGDKLHRSLFNKDNALKENAKKAASDNASSRSEKTQDVLKEEKEDRMLTFIANNEGKEIPTKKKTQDQYTKTADDTKRSTNASGAKGQELQVEDRELKKSKTDKGGWDGGGGGGWSADYHFGPDWGGSSSSSSHDGRFGWDDDDDGPGWGQGGSDLSWDSGKSNKGSWDHDPGWGWGGSGKSGKSVGGGWGSGKSGKSGGGGWGSGKSGKGGWGRDDEWGGGYCGDQAHVTVTNLSFQQSFSEIFIMTAAKDVTDLLPIYVFGNRTNVALADLAQNADATMMENRYLNRRGVEQVKTFRDFDTGEWKEPFLKGGTRARFKIRTSGLGHRLSVAVGLPFTNDGAVVLEGERIYDGAEYWIPAIDVGIEGNIQTCWSVAAMQDDFPIRSQCFDDKDADLNDNQVPGEGFVSMHRGIQDLDSKSDLEDLLLFKTCKELDLDNASGTTRFAEYFYEIGYNDDALLCRNPGSNCDPRDDQDFLDFLDTADDQYMDRYTELALDSADFNEFCDNIDDVNKAIQDAFTVLEPWLFDWRNDMMHVEIDCGWHDDGWDNDGWDIDGRD